ncbi:MAG: lipoyl synthase [Candidatus Aminicenantes bacterium]|nr:lipoyl synthase [Candidatus Aminicenantes bacterium]
MDYQKKPSWLKGKLPSHSACFQVAELLKKQNLHTICESARCPNLGECWERRTATFLILGNICTRNCGFCAVPKGQPEQLNEHEPEAVLEAVKEMGLKYVVLTSVTRDDLPDGGAEIFARTTRLIKDFNPEIRVEVLIPDFKGKAEPLFKVLSSMPDILNHNLETVERIYPLINRPAANYRRSLQVIKMAKDYGAITKSGLMVGLGEIMDELKQTMRELREHGCDLLTIGQYLQPSLKHQPVRRYYTPEEFDQLREMALELGFLEVVSGPLVRSSYLADKLFSSVKGRN